MKRLGPRMAQVLVFVRANPGCSKLAVARVIGPHGSTFFGYRPVNRCVRAGLVTARREAHQYHLFIAG